MSVIKGSLLKPANVLKKYYFRLPFKAALPQRDFYGGLIGCGHFVKCAYVPAFNKSNNPILISGLYSRSMSSSEGVKQTLRYKSNVFTSYEYLINSGVKAVIITAPNHLHYHYVVESLKRGIDVFCEKPITNTLEEAFHLKSILQDSPCILMVGFNQRYTDRIRRLKELIASGDVGNVSEVHAFHNQNVATHLSNSDWLSDTNKSGGGVLHNAGIHLVNVMIDIFGGVEKVTADFRNIKMPVNFGEDTAYCKFRFKSGVHGYLNASFVGAVDSTYEHIVIKTDKAIVTSDMRMNNIIIENNSKQISRIQCSNETVSDTIYNELKHFYSCIKTKKSHLPI